MADSTANELAAQAASEASTIVSEKFNSAQSKADAAQTAAQSAITSLTSRVTSAQLSNQAQQLLNAIVLNYNPGTVSSFTGTAPQKPTLFTQWSSLIKPVLGTIKEIPSFSALVSSIDATRELVIERIFTILTEGATGLDASVEQQIWDRLIARNELENVRQYTEVENYYAARGYTLPPGVLAGRLEEINIEIGRKNADINSGISIEQAKLAQTNFQFLVEKGIAVILDMMKTSITSVIEYNKGTLEAFIADAERYKSEITSYMALNESSTKLYASEAEAYKAKGTVVAAEVDAQTKIETLKLEKAKAVAEIALKGADIQIDMATKAYGLQVEAMKASAQVMSQVAASALSGINASASVGFSGVGSASDSATRSATSDLTKSVESFETIRHQSV
jgi:hypothetical protein